MSKDTRNKIMDAAKQLFSVNGYAAVTTKEIAKQANISEVTIFRYFDNKRNLFNVIVKEHMHNYDIVSFIKNDVTYDIRYDLTFIAEKIVDGYRKNSALIKMMIKDAILNSDVHKSTQNKKNSDLAAVLEYFKILKEKKLIKDDAKKLMIFFISNINGFALRNYILKNNKDENKEDEYFNWLINKVIDTILM